MTDEKQFHHIITIDELGDLKKKINVVYDKDGVAFAMDQATDYIAKNAKVKGFRKGKAPKELIKKPYQKNIKVLLEDILKQKGYLHACNEHKLFVLKQPEFSEGSFDVDGSYKFSVVVEVKPNINPTGYIGLTLEKPESNKEEVIKNQLNALKYQYLSYENISEIEDDSIVKLSCKISVDDEVINDVKDHSLVVTSNHEPPFGPNLFGHKVGEEVKEKIVLPESYKENAGKEADVLISVNEVQRKILPSDEDLIKLTGFESREKLDEAISNLADRQILSNEKAALEEQIINKLLELHDFVAPENWVEDEIKFLSQSLQVESMEDEHYKVLQEMAERNVKRTFMLEAIYDEEPSLRLTQKEVDEACKSVSEEKGMDLETFKKKLQESKQVDAFIAYVKHNKIINMILSNANIVEKNEVNEDNSLVSVEEVPEAPF